jgi:hypothetical protein
MLKYAKDDWRTLNSYTNIRPGDDYGWQYFMNREYETEFGMGYARLSETSPTFFWNSRGRTRNRQQERYEAKES